MLSDTKLRRWYREYNRRFFGGALSDDVDILYAPVEGCCADVDNCPAHDFVLRINPAYAINVGFVRLALLHEMVHIKLWPCQTHGAAFQREMKRLAAADAFRGLW